MQCTSKLELCKTTKMIIVENEKIQIQLDLPPSECFLNALQYIFFYPKKSSWTLLTYSLFCGVITDASSEITVMFRSWRRSGSTSLLTQTSSQHQHEYENPWGNQHRTWCGHLEQGSSASSQWLCRVAELDVNHNNHTVQHTLISDNEDHFYKLILQK